MAAPEADPTERAKQEAEVLKLIFGDDVLDCKMYDCWKRFKQLQMWIHFANEKLAVDLELNCPPDYPNHAPKFTLSRPVGLTQDDIDDLTDLLNDKIQNFERSEILYDLCLEVQGFLKSKPGIEKVVHERTINKQESTSSVNERSIRSESVKRQHNRNSFTEYEIEANGLTEIKKEEELKCRRNQLLKQLGTLGNTIKVELLSKPGQLIDIAKIMSFEVARKPTNKFTYEWFGFDQNRVLLVTEYRFDSSVNSRNKEALVNFRNTLNAFIESAKIRSYTNDNFLTQFAFLHSKKEKRSKFSVDLLVGQYIEVDSKCLGAPKVLSELKNKKKSLLPRLANHLLCGLKALHEQRFLHGNITLDSVWINTDDNFFISDHSLMPEIMQLYDQFAQINTVSEKQRQSSVSSLRLKDFQMVGNLLKSLSTDFYAIPDRETFDDFIFQCSRPDVDAQRLLNHSFLYQGFNSMSSMSDESLLSSANLISTENAGRLVGEYNVLGFLGSGGFGSVFLARNKLDGNDYAIKRISLSGMSKKQVEKIKNEVAVFSRLSNEHITRYFSSWVETIELKTSSSESTTATSCTTDLSLANELPARIRNLTLENKTDESEEPSPESGTSVSSSGPGFFRGGPKRSKAPAVLPNIMSQGGSDLSIMFIGDDQDDDQLEDVSEADEENSTTEKPKTASFLCLQMEFCSNKTLRSLIDYHQLYSNSAMIWRLFKEILLGLEFMHSYNLIHRDIKPGNIFLDSNWSVKIGDFGLATRLATVHLKETVDKEATKDKSFQGYSMTKDIGTAFYIPPEAKRGNVAKHYDEKFDIYSTGIVLFEMIMKPPESRSERVSCLERLRNELTMPIDYLNYLPEKQRDSADSIIKWCLREHPEERPSASELLQSDLLPQIISEEDKFLKTCAHIAQDPKHRNRRLLFNELFSPVLPASISVLYDKNYSLEQQKRRRFFTYNWAIIDLLSTFFRSQGFSHVQLESLIPSMDNYSTDDELYGYFGSLSKPYKLIDENGVILSLPANLRQNLARYFAHSNIQRIRSFSIGRTHSQSTSTSAFSLHPDTRNEFCLDILRPKTSNVELAAVEMLQLIVELSRKLHSLLSTPDSTIRWQILLNHADLVKAIGIYYSISEQQRLCSFFNLLYDFSSRLKKTEYSSLAFEFARNFSIPEKQANELIQLIDTPVRSIHKLREHLRTIINSRNVRSLVENSFNEMDLLFQKLCHNLDASLEFTFLPSFVYQPLVFNTGPLFSLRVEISDKGKKCWVPIVGGGQYDQFLQKTRHINEPGSSIDTCAYGINISVENISHLLKNASGNVTEQFGLACAVLITCTSIGYLNAAQELAKLLREKASMFVELWNEEMQLNDALFEYSRDKFTNFIVALVSANEFVIYMNSFDKTVGNNGFRLLHNRISLTDAFKFISSSTTKKEHIEGEVQKGAESERAEPTNVPTNATLSNVNLAFCISRGFKTTHHIKKKYESLVYSILQNVVKRFNKSIRIDAYITELPPEVLTQISNLDRSAGQNHIFVEFEAIANSQARYKTDVKLLYDELESFFQQPSTSNHVVFLFCPRLSETFYRVLI